MGVLYWLDTIEFGGMLVFTLFCWVLQYIYDFCNVSDSAIGFRFFVGTLFSVFLWTKSFQVIFCQMSL